MVEIKAGTVFPSRFCSLEKEAADIERFRWWRSGVSRVWLHVGEAEQYLNPPVSGSTLPPGCSGDGGGGEEGGNGRLQFNGISAYRVGSSRVRTLNDVPEVPVLILRVLGRVYRRCALSTLYTVGSAP